MVIFGEKLYLENRIVLTLIIRYQCEYWVCLFSINLKREPPPKTWLKIKCVFAASPHTTPNKILMFLGVE